MTAKAKRDSRGTRPVPVLAPKRRTNQANIEFSRLRKWRNELNICIRCGYCYEHCPLFRTSDWEIDTPRGRLLLTYGLLTGDVKPSAYVAEKLFECFYCRNCSKSCSAKVSPPDIFTDARADLSEAGFVAQGTTVTNDETRCMACGRCVPACKSEALSMDMAHMKVLVDRVKCKGCGVCVAECPVGAMSQREGLGVSREELSGRIMDSLSSMNEGPKVIVLSCNSSITPGLQLSRMASAGPRNTSGIIVTACSGRIDPGLILDTLQRGALGVMIACCPLGECESDGNYRAQERCASVWRLLGLLGVGPERLRLEFFATGEAQKLKAAVKSFAGEMALLGPL
jgi:coenzyme F420-reducing hydrogenase delta subunit/formate hydrogenlyase subunit 6/NADH:ubiquinone oxidoreductase subunit I